MNKALWAVIGVAVVGANVSAAVAYRLAGKIFDERLERETKLIRELYSKPRINIPVPTQPVEEEPTPVQEETEQDWVEYNKLVQPYSPDKPETAEIAEDGTAYWTESDERNAWVEEQSSEPVRVITVREFEDRQDPNNEGYVYDSISLTYFEGDDTLVDDQDVPIHNVREVVGDALQYFGYGSDSDTTVFVLNENLNAAYEIELDPRSFAEVVG